MALHTLTIEIDLTDDELHTLAAGAFKVGFIRADPSKPWDVEEYKAAAIFVARDLVLSHVDGKMEADEAISEEGEG